MPGNSAEEGDQSCICVSPDEALLGTSNALLASASFTGSLSILPHDVPLLLYRTSLHGMRVRSYGRDLGQWLRFCCCPACPACAQFPRPGFASQLYWFTGPGKGQSQDLVLHALGSVTEK